MDFTIVTPSYRQLDWLACCIASVADQEGVTVEHIVQDAQTEGFAEFAEKMRQRWPDREGYRRVMISEPDNGMYDAVNKGLKRGSGRICAYLNCDEQYLPGALRRVKNQVAADPGPDLWVGDVIVVDSSGQALCQRKVLPPTRRHTWSCHLSALTAATFFRAPVIESNFFFDPSYRAAADAEWFVRLLQAGKKIGRLGLVCSTFVEGDRNLGLSPAALRERERLDRSAPSWIRAFSWFWVLEHRARRWLWGCHKKSDTQYEIYLPAHPRRNSFAAPRLRTSWPNRLWQK